MPPEEYLLEDLLAKPEEPAAPEEPEFLLDDILKTPEPEPEPEFLLNDVVKASQAEPEYRLDDVMKAAETPAPAAEPDTGIDPLAEVGKLRPEYGEIVRKARVGQIDPVEAVVKPIKKYVTKPIAKAVGWTAEKIWKPFAYQVELAKRQAVTRGEQMAGISLRDKVEASMTPQMQEEIRHDTEVSAQVFAAAPEKVIGGTLLTDTSPEGMKYYEAAADIIAAEPISEALPESIAEFMGGKEAVRGALKQIPEMTFEQAGFILTGRTIAASAGRLGPLKEVAKLAAQNPQTAGAAGIGSRALLNGIGFFAAGTVREESAKEGARIGGAYAGMHVVGGALMQGLQKIPVEPLQRFLMMPFVQERIYDVAESNNDAIAFAIAQAENPAQFMGLYISTFVGSLPVNIIQEMALDGMHASRTRALTQEEQAFMAEAETRLQAEGIQMADLEALAPAELAPVKPVTPPVAPEAIAPPIAPAPEAIVEPAPAVAPPAVTGKAAEVHEYSSTQVELPAAQAEAIRQLGAAIPEAEIYTDPEDPSLGREDQPHVTVKFGLHTEDVEEVRPLVEGTGPITAKLGKVSIFESEKYDVVKIDIDSPQLHALNKKIAEGTKVTDTHPTYKPHATIAYVKKGEGQKYVGNTALEGAEITLDSVTFSAKDGTKTAISLAAQPTETRPALGAEEITKALMEQYSKIAPEMNLANDEKLQDLQRQADKLRAVGDPRSQPEIDKLERRSQTLMYEKLKKAKAAPAAAPAPRAFIPAEPGEAPRRGPGFVADMAEIRRAQEREATRTAEAEERTAIQAEAQPAPTAVQSILEQYDTGEGDIQSVPDIADAIEALDDPPAEALSAVAKYKAEIQEDFEEFGLRGDVEQYEEDFISALEAIAPGAPPAEGAERIMGTDVTVVKTHKAEDGIDYELYKPTDPEDKRGFVRVVDTESGEVVTVNRAPTLEQAESKYEESIKVAGPPRGVGEPATDYSPLAVRRDTAQWNTKIRKASRKPYQKTLGFERRKQLPKTKEQKVANALEILSKLTKSPATASDIAIINEGFEAVRQPGKKKGLGKTISSVIPKKVPSTTITREGATHPKTYWDLKGLRVRNAQDATAASMMLRSPYQESFKVMYLDKNHNVLGAKVTSYGTPTQAAVFVRLLFENVPKGTEFFLTSHNHPSGKVTPSRDDNQVDKAINTAADAMEIKRLDNIITDDWEYYSYAEGATGQIRGEVAIKEVTERVGFPEEMAEPGKPLAEIAPWSLLPRAKRAPIGGPEAAQHIVESLRQANPNTGHVILLDGQNAILAINRFPLDGTPGGTARYIGRLIASEGGTAALIMDFPHRASGSKWMKEAVNDIVFVADRAFDVKLVDVIDEDGESLAEKDVLPEARDAILRPDRVREEPPAYTEEEKAIMSEEAGITTGRAGSPLIDYLRSAGVKISVEDVKRVTGFTTRKDISARWRRFLRKSTTREGARITSVENLDLLAESILIPGGEIFEAIGGIYARDKSMKLEDQLIEILDEEATRPRITKARRMAKPARRAPMPEEPPRPTESVEAFRDRMKMKKEPTESAEAFYERIVTMQRETMERSIGITPDLMTSGQKRRIDKIADNKLLRRGKKYSSGFLRLLKSATDRTTMKNLTHDEAAEFIEHLERLPEKEIGYKGVERPPSVPKTTALAAPGEFAAVYGEPAAGRYVTSPEYYAEALKLDVKSLVRPAELGKLKVDLEYAKGIISIDKQIAKLNRAAGTTWTERMKAKRTNRPTAAVAKLRNMLDQYEEAPPEMSKAETEVFNWFRDLTRLTFTRQNEVRKAVGIEPIPYRKAYIRHVAKGLVQDILEGKYPFPEGKKFWAKEIVAKKIHNTMEQRRLLESEVERIFSRDAAFAAKSMLWTALKEIHLTQPLHYLQAQLNAKSKDMPVYKSLSPAERRRQAKIEVLPATTRKWVRDYVNITIKGQQSDFDMMVENTVKTTGLKGLLNKVLAPFGRSIGYKPIANFQQVAGKAMILGALGGPLGGNPRQILRNKFQLVQNLALNGVRATLKSFFPASAELTELLNDSLFLEAYTGIEEWPADFMGKMTKIALRSYQWSATSNAAQSMEASYHNFEKYFDDSDYKQYGWVEWAKKHGGKDKVLLREMEFNAAATQHNYTAMGMPELFRHKTLTPVTRLSSWWLNHFMRFNQEALHRMFYGRPGWAPADGPSLSWSDRLGWLKYALIGIPILHTMGYMRSYLWGAAPDGFPPFLNFLIGIYLYLIGAASGNERTKKQGERATKGSGKLFIPGYLAWQDWKKLINIFKGKERVSSLFFYNKGQIKKWIDEYGRANGNADDIDLEDLDFELEDYDLDFEDIDFEID